MMGADFAGRAGARAGHQVLGHAHSGSWARQSEAITATDEEELFNLVPILAA